MSARSLLLLTLLGAPLSAGALTPDGRLVVVVDPGHGGDKLGALGPKGEKEKELVLAIALATAEQLRAAGCEVLLTRADDVALDLPERVELANRRGADLFVSIHLNSMPTRRGREKVEGLETYFLAATATDKQAALLAASENRDDAGKVRKTPKGSVAGILDDLTRRETHADSSRLAFALHARLLEATQAKDRGVRQAPFYVLEGAAMPAVLIEAGYISHPLESVRLGDPAAQRALGEGITRGVQDFLRDVVLKRAAPEIPPDAVAIPLEPAPAR